VVIGQVHEIDRREFGKEFLCHQFSIGRPEPEADDRANVDSIDETTLGEGPSQLHQEVDKLALYAKVQMAK
jgi:hypothetical protein